MRRTGRQEGSTYNGYCRCECYHRIFCINQDSDVEGAMLRNCNMVSDHDWPVVLVSVLGLYRDLDIRRLFRGDAVFVIPDLHEFLEAEGLTHAIRLPANAVLYRGTAHLIKRPVGRPPTQPIVLYHRYEYQAATWKNPRTLTTPRKIFAAILVPIRRLAAISPKPAPI